MRALRKLLNAEAKEKQTKEKVVIINGESIEKN